MQGGAFQPGNQHCILQVFSTFSNQAKAAIESRLCQLRKPGLNPSHSLDTAICRAHISLLFASFGFEAADIGIIDHQGSRSQSFWRTFGTKADIKNGGNAAGQALNLGSPMGGGQVRRTRLYIPIVRLSFWPTSYLSAALGTLTCTQPCITVFTTLPTFLREHNFPRCSQASSSPLSSPPLHPSSYASAISPRLLLRVSLRSEATVLSTMSFIARTWMET